MEQQQLGDFAPTLNPELSQYHTPMKLARRMVEWAGDLRGKFVIEPSAGGGNIVRELMRQGAFHVCAVECDPAWAKFLETEFGDERVVVGWADFLEVEPRPYHLAVMNPPLDDGVAAIHVRRALEWAPRVISIMRGQDLHCQRRWRELWSDCDLARLALMVNRPKYSGAGGQIETIVVDVYHKGTYSGPQVIEHWPDDWR